MSGIVLVGLGRIGRLFLRLALQGSHPLPIRAIIDVSAPEALAALMTFDSNYGHASRPITFRNGAFDFGEGRTIPYYHPDQYRYDDVGAPRTVALRQAEQQEFTSPAFLLRAFEERGEPGR